MSLRILNQPAAVVTTTTTNKAPSDTIGARPQASLPSCPLQEHGTDGEDQQAEGAGYGEVDAGTAVGGAGGARAARAGGAAAVGAARGAGDDGSGPGRCRLVVGQRAGRVGGRARDDRLAGCTPP